MLITTPEELQKYLPSSVYDDTDTLVVLTERAERKHLVPVLGNKLYKYLCDVYATLQDGENDGEEATPVTDNVARLLSLCQSAVAYFTVADNAGQLSLSFNQGNGLAQINTDGYTAATEDALKRFLGDVWHQARQDVDDICHLLEDIAVSLPARTDNTESQDNPENPDANLIELWRSSEWFYLQGDCLLATCRETKRYVMASEQPFSYAEYVNLLGELRTRQEANIAPELGEELMGALVRTQYEAHVFKNGDEQATRQVLHLLRLALMSFVRWHRTDRPKYENDARMFLFRAVEMMQMNQDRFMPYIGNSPIYVAPKVETDEEDKEESRLYFGAASDSIFNPFGV